MEVIIIFYFLFKKIYLNDYVLFRYKSTKIILIIFSLNLLYNKKKYVDPIFRLMRFPLE